jgi:hypothetical protein
MLRRVIFFDGDGDRIGVVDSTGTIIWPDQLLLLLAQDVRCRRCRGRGGGDRSGDTALEFADGCGCDVIEVEINRIEAR